MTTAAKGSGSDNAARSSRSLERSYCMFVRSVELILLLTACLKYIAVSSESLSLSQPDPVLPFLSQRQIALMAAVLETGVAFVLLSRRCLGHEIKLILWLVSVFILYRAAAYTAGWRGPCLCLGPSGGAMFVFSSWTGDWLAKLALLWMLAGSLLLLVRVRQVVNKSSTNLAAGIAVCLAFAPHHVDAEHTLHLLGDIQVRGFDTDGSVQYEKRFLLETWRGETHWKIKVDFTDYAEIVGWDGETTCYLWSGTPEKLRRELGPGWASYLPSGYITEGISTYPFLCEPTTRIVWLALASSAYFRLTNAPELPAISSMGFNDAISQLVHSSSIVLLDETLALPASVDFEMAPQRATTVANWPFLSYTVSDDDLRRAANQMQANQGVVVGEYRVLRTTNVYAVTLPAEFQLEVFLPQEGARIRWQRFHGVVARIEKQQMTRFLPEARRIAVRDYRFLDRALRLNEVAYVATNGIWPSEDEPWLRELVEQQRTAHRMSLQRNPSPARRVLIALLIGTILLLPVLLLRWKRQAAAVLGNVQKE